MARACVYTGLPVHGGECATCACTDEGTGTAYHEDLFGALVPVTDEQAAKDKQVNAWIDAKTRHYLRMQAVTNEGDAEKFQAWVKEHPDWLDGQDVTP